MLRTALNGVRVSANLLSRRSLTLARPNRFPVAAAARKVNDMPEFKRDTYLVPNDSPVLLLDCEEAFTSLTEKEKQYAYHIARASANGTLIVFAQVSPESPALFAILHQLFTHESVEQVKERALAAGWTESEATALFCFASAFYANGGNYKGFGDSKIIPDIEQDKLTALLNDSVAFKTRPNLAQVWSDIADRVYSLDEKYLSLGFPANGVTTYHSSNMQESDAKAAASQLSQLKFETWNTRLVKDKDGGIIVRIASVEEEETVTSAPNGSKIIFKKGDYSPILARVCDDLQNAIEFAANDHQKEMLKSYINHFKTGEIKDHKIGSQHWIKDVGPAVESYIGFIENYRDPDGTRSEFEGFVAAVNKETSKKFQELVSRAEEFIAKLPWPQEYEKDKFLKPDFTALEVLYFGSSGIPAGINIPNYDDIRQDIGFKNVSLSNVLSAMPKFRIEFLSDEDEAMMKKYHKESFEVQVGLHELLGHGSGKLFIEEEPGKFNFDIEKVKHMVTGKAVEKWYKAGESWGSKFGSMSGAYEECRAEAVGYYLCCDPAVMKIFGFDGDVAEDVMYANWLNEIRAGLVSLEFYNPDKGWGQAHCYARYVLLKVVMEASKDFVRIEKTVDAEGKNDLRFTLDRNLIRSVGKPAVGEFLKKLQVYKSTGDFEAGKALFEGYGKVGPEELEWRQVVIDRRKPRRIFVQPNFYLDNGAKIKCYNTDFAGVINSFVERHCTKSVDELLDQYSSTRNIFGL